VTHDPTKSLEQLAGHPQDGYYLRMVAGPTVGKTWFLAESVNLIGRGVGCHIRIDDSHVSRVQCELVRGENGPCLRNLGRRNPTCVNGVAREETVLSPGDLISFAGSALLLDCGHAAGPELPVSPSDSRTTQTFADTIHLHPKFEAVAYLHDPGLVGDLHSLLTLLRSLGQAESLEILVSRLVARLRDRLRADDVWSGWRLGVYEDVVLYPPASPEETRAAPLEIMRDACAGGEGIMAPELGAQSDSHILAAPLIQGGDSFGAMAARRAGPQRPFTENDLQYLVTVAECCAPLIRAAERMEQMERDARATASWEAHSIQMLGTSATMQALHSDIRRAAIARVNVILQGETGVGKELAARMLHDLSARCSGPYVVANCAAIARELFESEVFGHERGAFTGASRRRKGLFELAQGGTLFLDEISELSTPIQAQLLRAVETGAFRPVGAEKELKVDVRIVCATNRQLPDSDQRYFRSDLYYRLAGIVIRIKPLREHKEDMVELAQHFLKLAEPHAPAHPREFTMEALDKLMAYDWPGNIRELRNVVDRACYMASAPYITGQDIHIEGAVPLPPASVGITSFEDLERHHLLDMLRRHGNSVAQAASALGVARSTLYYRLAHHNIKPRELSK
jgi:DNA-binding NtrC family response regulator